MATQQKKKSSNDYDEDDDEDDEDYETEEEDEEDEEESSSKAKMAIMPKKESKQYPAKKEDKPQVIQIPRVISSEEMLNIIYDQQLQIINLLQKQDETR